MSHDEHRSRACDMLKDTKLHQEGHVICKIIGEYIYNEEFELTSTQSTITHFHKLGSSYSIGNFSERMRY